MPVGRKKKPEDWNAFPVMLGLPKHPYRFVALALISGAVEMLRQAQHDHSADSKTLQTKNASTESVEAFLVSGC